MGNEISNINGASGVHLGVLSEASASPGFETSLLPEPAIMNDPMAELEALMVKMKSSDKQYARETKLMAEQSIQQAVDSLVKDMKQKADAQLWSGIAAGAGQVASGLLRIDAAGGSEQAMELAKAQGDLAEGLGGASSGAFQSFATGEDAEIVAGQAKLSAGERDASAAQAQEQDATQGMRDLLARIDRIRQAEQGAQQAALFRA